MVLIPSNILKRFNIEHKRVVHFRHNCYW
jgi:hypothetical protein